MVAIEAAIANVPNVKPPMVAHLTDRSTSNWGVRVQVRTLPGSVPAQGCGGALLHGPQVPPWRTALKH